MQDSPASNDSGPRREAGLSRAVQILDFLHAHGRPASPGDIARGLGAPRSTIYSLVRTLSDCGLLDANAGDGRVYFGRKHYLWGMDYMRENALLRQGRRAVDELAAETGETTELCMLHEGRYAIIHMCPGARPFRISSAVGLQIPLPWTASGRLLLSGLARPEVDRLVQDEDLTLPDGRRINREIFHAEIAEAAERGFCVTTGLVDAVTKCLAVPIRDSDRSVAATLCFVLPINTADSTVTQLRKKLLDRARNLSMDLAS
ncbi:IclR family transcriptional regulator [Frigidibacter sp. ROC022]|uniref:IclR family transcriptional regulator n=1 Tax=Frigidibacter sp. ROC022 TaxID=2971796 RepID=UPI00215A1C14|nr:IclR family transcriptional regulator [Frigidibacter sp. ROC022]MCR8726108.1 IclR family transcriptional regulator [Frigidibacter sp. ROC022]